MPASGAVDKAITDDDIVTKAISILDQSDQPMRLSVLGQELNKALGTSIRKHLGNRALGDLILAIYGDRYEVQGFGPHKEIGRIGTWKMAPRFPHYCAAFWKNFERPLDDGQRRWLPSNGELTAIDSPQDPFDGASIEIEKHFVFDDADFGQKGKLIRHNIELWAKANKVDLRPYFQRPDATAASEADKHGATAHTSGLKALKTLIEAVPVEERSKYSLPMDLLAKLLNFS